MCFEYLVEWRGEQDTAQSLTAYMNRRGKERWQFCSVYPGKGGGTAGGMFIFKRELN